MQNKEPDHFLAMFDGKMIIFSVSIILIHIKDKKG